MRCVHHGVRGSQYIINSYNMYLPRDEPEYFIYYDWMNVVTQARIDSSVRAIKNWAFNRMDTQSLLRIIILNGELEDIREHAFEGCT
jgi:hypothetical protein